MAPVTGVVVFVGPSLPRDAAQRLLPTATYLPPARQADLLSAVETYRPDVIGLIDGAFGQSSSVWHKEILFALERGVRVFGAASMGALRAVELVPFGMVGVGEIYRRFVSGELADDDEVAVSHASAADDYRPLSLPVVNLRASLALAHRQHVIVEAEQQLVIAAAKTLYFPDRTLPTIFERAMALGLRASTTDRLSAFLPERWLDLKRRDAALLLRLLGELPSRPAAPLSFVLERSVSFETMYDNDRSVRHADADVPLREIAAYAALHHPVFDELNATALNRALVLFLADLLHVAPTPAEIQAELARFCAGRSLADDASLQHWLRRHGLGRESFAVLMRELATCRRLQRWLIARDRGTHHTRWILDELRLRGDYPDALEAAAQQVRLLAAWNLDAGTGGEALPDEDLDLSELAAEHTRATDWHPDVALEVWAEVAGFETAQDLAIALARAARARERLRAAARALTGGDATVSTEDPAPNDTAPNVTPGDLPNDGSAADASADSV